MTTFCSTCGSLHHCSCLATVTTNEVIPRVTASTKHRRTRAADRAAEYLITAPKEGAPFSLYTKGRNGWDAPRLTLPGKVPHRMASGVVG